MNVQTLSLGSEDWVRDDADDGDVGYGLCQLDEKSGIIENFIFRIKRLYHTRPLFRD